MHDAVKFDTRPGFGPTYMYIGQHCRRPISVVGTAIWSDTYIAYLCTYGTNSLAIAERPHCRVG